MTEPSIQNPIILVERDHRVMVSRWRALTDALDQSADHAHVRDAIRGLIACAREHFRNEEWAMRQTSYADYLNHKMDHTRLLKEAEDMLRNFDDAFGPSDWSALSAYYRHWLSRHNERYDKALHAHVRKIKADATQE